MKKRKKKEGQTIHPELDKLGDLQPFQKFRGTNHMHIVVQREHKQNFTAWGTVLHNVFKLHIYQKNVGGKKKVFLEKSWCLNLSFFVNE